MILRLESTDGWRRVNNVNDRVDREGSTDEIAQVTWRRRLEELVHGASNFVFNVFLCLDPV